MKIIQHHDNVDFNAVFAEGQGQQIGPAFNDFATILHKGDEIHSFYGASDGTNRVNNALINAYASDEAIEILNRSIAILICIIYAPETDRPLGIAEFEKLKDVVVRFPSDTDVVWLAYKDNSLGNEVKTYTLVSVHN